MTGTKRAGQRARPSGAKRRGPAPPMAEWIPRSVGSWIEANRTHPEHVSGRDLIDRIANDVRLRALWAELDRKKRCGYVHEPNCETLRKSGIDLGDADDAHDLALVWLFKQILHIATTPFPVRTKGAATAQAADYRRRAEFLRTEAADTLRLRPGAAGIDWRIVATAMVAKADILEQAATEGPTYFSTLAHARKNAVGLQAASRISAILLALFGKPFANQSATIATVLTGETVTVEQVRDLTRKSRGGVTFRRKTR